MNNSFFAKSLVSVLITLVFGTQAQVQAQDSMATRLIRVQDAVRSGDYSQLTAKELKGVQAGLVSAASAADMKAAPSDITKMVKQAVDMQQLAKEAYVAALPARDQAIGRSVMLGDRTVPGKGKLYYFVSRSMPISILKAYAIDAMYTGGTLVVKGVRKGDTLKEYIEEVVSDFNKADGNVLAGLEMNPNLYDMFGVTMVPTVVWTNRTGLDEIGSSCENLPDDAVIPQIEMEGPDNIPVFLEKPICAKLPESTYYKITGVLNTNYVLDRFESAGADKTSIKELRGLLAGFKQNINQGTPADSLGNGMAGIEFDLSIDKMPNRVLLGWEESLKTMKVHRSGWGPAFGVDGEDDEVYRAELKKTIERGLGRAVD